jgi:hypothetical protein
MFSGEIRLHEVFLDRPRNKTEHRYNQDYYVHVRITQIYVCIGHMNKAVRNIGNR